MPLSASELSLTEVKDKVPPLRRLDPGLMPLPDTVGGLEWSSLVSAAKAYEGEDGNTSIVRLVLFNLGSVYHSVLWIFVVRAKEYMFRCILSKLAETGFYCDCCSPNT